MKKIAGIAGLAFCLVLDAALSAQPRFQAGGNFTLAYPQREFSRNVDAVGIGGSGFFAYRFGRTPFLAGLSGGFWIYGSDTREVPFNPDVPEVTVDVTTTNSIVRGDLIFRIQPQTGAIQPYIDGLMGFNYLNTTTRIDDQSDNEEIASSTNYDDAAFGIGFGGGLMVRVYDGAAQNAGAGLQAVLVDFGVRSLKGGEAEYLKEGSITRQNGKVRYEAFKSETDMVTYHLGVSFDFIIRSQPGE